MAQYGGTVDWPEIDFRGFGGLRKAIEQENERLDEYLNVSRSLPEGKIVGAVVSFPVADGAAFYVVTKERPLTLKHIPVGDAWHVSQETMRGINRDTVLRQLGFNKLFKETAARQKAAKGKG